MTTAILSDPRHAAHTDPMHVERAERLRAIDAAIDAAELREELRELAPREAARAELEAVHSPRMLEALERAAQLGGGHIDPDTYMTEGSWQAALLGAGAALRAVESVLSGEVDNAFALIRPPGHHATSRRPMGFCLVNNIAVAARHATTALGVERVAIVDYDVHHGNGTQDIFYGDGSVLFCSTHSATIYPGSGAAGEQGVGAGAGTTLNIPLPPGVGDVGYGRIFAQLIEPALRRFRPQLLLVSAGFDAHWDDPLGNELLSAAGYGQLTRSLVRLAGELCDGRIVLTLEGGYSLPALGACVVAALDALLGRPARPDPLGPAAGRETDIVSLITAVQRGHPLLHN
jgi:acetoin utilization deacetylase AcuC-like enzyme